MKKSVLLIIFFLFAAYNFSKACSCRGPVTFCETKRMMGLMIRGIKIDQDTIINDVPLKQNYMRVKVIDKYWGNFNVDTIVVMGSDGLNCNESVGLFKDKDTLFLGFSSMRNIDTFDLSFCGHFYLHLKNNFVTGNINTWPDTTSIPYDSFLTFLDSKPCTEAAGLEEISEQNILTVFPNPSASGIFNLNFDTDFKNFEFSVYNAFGQLVKTSFINTQENNPTPLDLSAQPNGIYFIKLEEGNKLITARILKN